MKSRRRSCTRALAQLSLAIFVGCSGSESLSPSAEQAAASEREAELAALAAIPTVTTKDLCPRGKPGMRCFGKQVTSMNGNVMAVAPVPIAGLTAQDLQRAYNLPTSGGNGRLVAVIIAYDVPNAESDLRVYRQMYGLPPCTVANGCFRRLNQEGNPGPYPRTDPDWAGEAMLDLAMVSAACPDCNIVLVEANSNLGVDLGPCVARAKQLGAVAINNSYGGPESDPDSIASFQYFNQPGALVVASSGDDGYLRTPQDDGGILAEIAFPAASPYVLSVGGTSLRTSPAPRGWVETAWGGAGSGCSKSQAKPNWQKDPGCSKRFVADVSAVGDPVTGPAYYYAGSWRVAGGTSVSAPLVAGIAALFNVRDPSWPYAHTNAFFDVTSGNNGSCGGTYQCTAMAGVDGPTGIGSPNGALWATDGGATTGGAGAGGSGAGGSGGSGSGNGGSGGAAGSPTTTTTAAGGGGATTGNGAGGGSGGATTGSGGGTTTGGGSATTGGGSATTGGGSTTTAGGAGNAATGGASNTGAGGSGVNPLAPNAAEESGCSCRLRANGDQVPTKWSGLVAIAMGVLVAKRRRRSLGAHCVTGKLPQPMPRNGDASPHFLAVEMDDDALSA